MIRVDQLSKRYMIYDRPLDRLRDWLGARRGRPFWALRDLSLEVPRGRSVGIVGVNGAGKSTLLKILTGTTLPTTGRFEIQGRISSLLELGTGFHPEFTGRQNVLFAGRMAGLEDSEIHERLDSILAFSELGDFIDQPVRTYSSGMTLRLGFALASSVDPDVLMIDEALSVGDLHFQQKCLARIRAFHERGVTVLFVSHDPSMIKRFCDEALLLDEGRLLDRDTPGRVLDHYTALLAEKYREGGARTRIIAPAGGAEVGSAPATDDATEIPTEDAPPPLHPRGHRTGNFEAVITGVWFTDDLGRPLHALATSGERVQLHVRSVARRALPEATVGIAIKDRLGQEVYGTNTHLQEIGIGPIEAGRRFDVCFDLPLDLGDGLYSVTAALHGGASHVESCYDWIEQALAFQILPDPAVRFTGICRLGAVATASPARAASAAALARAAAVAPDPAAAPAA